METRQYSQLLGDVRNDGTKVVSRVPSWVFACLLTLLPGRPVKLSAT